MRLIADELGVSVSLVSRVLSGKANEFRISERTEKAILNAAKKHNYSPNRVARGLRLQKTNTLGIVVPNISNPFFSSIVRHIERAAREHQYSILLADSQDDEQVERSSIEVLRASMVDGIVIAPCGIACDHLVETDKENFPIVCVDGYFPGSGLPYVISDHVGGAKLATRDLLEHGHRRIVFFRGYPEVQVSVDRVEGFKAALEEYGVEPRADMIVSGEVTSESGYGLAKEVLSRRHPPTGLIAFNSEIALGALRALQEQGLSVPADVSLVAFDDLPWIPHLRVPFNTVAHNYEIIGHHVLELLEARRARRSPPEELNATVPMGMVDRGSVARRKKKPAQVSSTKRVKRASTSR